MPARVVLVHDDLEFREKAAAALRAAGYDVTAFSKSMAASAALKEAHFTDLLITRVRFPVGTPHGAALARMARHKRPEIKVLFAAAPEMREHTDGLGEFMPMPVDMQELVEVVAKMLDRDDQAPS